LAMSFELFEKDANSLNKEKDGYYISIREGKYVNGTIIFNGGMRSSLKLTEYTSIETYRDNDNKLIAIKPNNEPRSGSNATLRKNGKIRFIASTSFTKLAVQEYGYPAGVNLPYKMLEDGIVVLFKEPDRGGTDRG
jgi:hypothetical protein